MDDRAGIGALMRELGFGRELIDVYLAVLTCGPLPRREIVAILGGASSTIDEALRLLRARGLVSSVTRRLRRRQFYAANPDIAWPALGAEMLWASTPRAWPRGVPPVAQDPRIEAQRRVCLEIAAAASAAWRPYAAALAHDEWDASTADEFGQLICEGISHARRSVMAVSTSPRLPQVALFWTTLTSRIAGGVAYRRVVDLEEVIDHGLAVVRRDIDDYGIDLRVLERSRIQHKFYVVDRSFLAVFHSRGEGPVGRVDAPIGRVTSRGSILRRYARRFEQYWTQAVPARTVLARLEAASCEVLRLAGSSLTAEEAAWIELLVQYGVFSRLRESEGWSPEKRARAEGRALEAGVVRRNLAGDLVPAYPVTEDDLRRAS